MSGSGAVRIRRKTARTFAALLAVSAITACGSSTSDDGTATTVKVGAPPIASSVPLWLGVEAGIFEKHGIDLEIDQNATTSALIPSVVSDTLQGAVYAWGGQFAGNANNLPIVGIANLSTGGASDEEDETQMVTLTSSGIDDLGELRGKTIGLNTLGGALHVEAVNMLNTAGLQPDDYELISISPTEQGAALRAGRIDAALLAEPFLTMLSQQEDINQLGGAHFRLIPSQPIINFVVATEWAESNPDAIESLQRALAEAVGYAEDNPDEARQVLQQNLDLPEAVVEEMTLPIFDSTIDLAKLQSLHQAMVDAGFIERELDVSNVILLPDDCSGDEPCQP